MYLQKLTIENIRGLKHFEMTFPENPAGWHVIIGDNGAGKSTLIRAISLGLIGPNEVRAAHPNFAEWLRKGEKKGFVELLLQADKEHDFTTKLGKARKLTAKVLLQSSHSLSGLRGGTPLVEAVADESKKPTPDKYLWSSTTKGWFSAGFGPFRRFTGGDNEYDKVYVSSPRCGAHLSVFGEDVALTEALRWLQEIDYQQLKAREKKVRLEAIPINLANNGDIAKGSEQMVMTEVEQLWEMATRLRKSSLFDEAELLLRRTLAISQSANGPDHSSVATSLNNLALVLKDTNRLAEAEPLMRRALAITEASFGPDHPKVATSLNNLALLLKDTNRRVEAEPMIRRSLAIVETNFGPNHFKVAIRLNNLAILLQDTNRLAEAEPLIRRALAITEASFGPDHPKVATSLNNLALLLKDMNQLTEAEPLMRRALAIDEISFGPDHPKVATSLINLAAFMQNINQLAEAEPLMRRALAIDEISYGPDHPNVSTDLNNLAILLQSTNRLAEAEPLMRRALTIDEVSYGPEHPRVAIRLGNLALILRDMNQLAEAESFMRRALAIDEISYGPDHPNVSTDLNNLAILLQSTNRLAEAEPLMRRALAITEASFSSDHPSIAINLSNLAVLLQNTNRLSEAEILMRRALAINETSFGPNHPNVVAALKNLTLLLHATNRAEEGSELVKQYEAKRTTLPEDSTNVSEIVALQEILLDENEWLAFRLRTFINESKLLPAGTEFKGMSADGPIFRDGNGQTVTVVQLSDGFRSILSVAFELIRQLIRAHGLAAVFPPSGAHVVIDLPGVILIDEVDIHLHPTWQTYIGQWFTRCFPQVQFIVTTHSPLICRAVTETTGSIWRLPTPGQGQKPEEVTGIERQRLRLGNVLDAYGTGLFGGQEVEQAAEATALLAELAKLSAREAVGKATPAELKRLRELRQLFPSNAEVEL